MFFHVTCKIFQLPLKSPKSFSIHLLFFYGQMKRSLPEMTADSDQDQGRGDIEIDVEEVPQGLCVECGDQPAETECVDCEEEFCTVCFDYLHRTGTRKEHATVALVKAAVPSTGITTEKQEQDVPMMNTPEESVASTPTAEDIDKASKEIQATRGDKPVGPTSVIDSSELLSRIREQCKYIPLRLSFEERKLLKLLEAALNVSEYTDKVDILSYTAKSKRIVGQLKEMCSILAGLVVSSDMNAGKNMFFGSRVGDQDYAASAAWYKKVCEIGRRYKIMNPEKMRDSFGKLMYMIMDSRMPEIKSALGFDLYTPIVTVYSYLEAHNDNDQAMALIEDPLVLQAVVEIVPDGKSRATIEAEIQRKESTIKSLAAKYATETLTEDAISQCLYSIGDYHAYLRANRHPVESIIKLLTRYFDPSGVDREYSLGIQYGRKGARLSHNHSKQFHYVHQSLTLWSQIMRDMFMLWFQADLDLVSDRSRYQLTDTGQGLNRVKACPSVNRSMHNIISKTMGITGKWIGSSVVHLGDRAVPNALFFLDKYTQVPRILTPVYLVIHNIDRIARDPFIHDWITSQFGSVDDVKISKPQHFPLSFSPRFAFIC